MPAKTQPDWADLRLGLVVAAVVAAALVAVFFAGAQRGPFLPDTYTLHVEVDDAGGIRVGSPVQVGGLMAGEVSDLDIVPPERTPDLGDTLLPLTGAEPDLRDIRLELTVQERFRPFVTSSSRAELASIGLGGERLVKISAGDVREPPLEPGSVVPTVASVDWDIVLARLARALNETREIVVLTDDLRAELESGSGTLPRVLREDSPIYPRVRALQREADLLLALVDEGPGLVGEVRRDAELLDRIDRLEDHIAELETALDEGPLRRWAEPVELRTALADLDASLAELADRIETGRGTWGRFVHDAELQVQLGVLLGEVRELIAAFKADPLGFVDIDLF